MKNIFRPACVGKHIVLLLIVFSILFSLTSCVRRQSRAKPVVGYEQEDDAEAPEELVLENEYLRLHFDTKTADIVLFDKVKGTQWHSTPVGAANDATATPVVKDLMMSQFSLQYADVSGVGETLFSHTQCIEKGNYSFELVDNGIEVGYTVGYVPRTYIIPLASPEERFKEYLSKLSEYRGRIESSYRLYDINNLRSNDNRSELLATYPDLANEKLYILRDSTQEYMKEDMEIWFEEAGYTLEEYYEDAARKAVEDVNEDPAFSLVLRYALDGNSLVVTVPFDKIAYRQAYPIVRLDILPFFGAGGVQDEGYMFVPDGSGALIYFNNGKQNQIASNNPVYGWDEATPRDAIVIDNKAPYPVFGIHKNGNAIVCIIEEGSSYASVTADVSGRNAAFNRVYSYFDMVHGSTMDISGRSDRAVYLYETGLPEGEKITLRYTPCSEPGYVGMAKEYRAWMLKNNPHLANRKTEGVPIVVEIIGAVNKTQHRLGIPFDLPLRLTTYKEAQEIIDDFANYGWKNTQIKLSGWFNKSYEHRVPSKISLINDLGNKNDFNNLVSAVKKNNFTIYPEADFMFVRDISSFDGFSLYRDAARYVTRKRVEKYPYSFVWYGERNRWGKMNYLVRPEVSINLIDGFLKEASSSYELNNIAFRNMGSKLAGDFHEKRHVSREASMIMRQNQFAKLSNEGHKIMVNTGYAYSAPYADIIVDMAVDCQNFAMTDVSVPFYQIVLSGLVPYTSRAINLAEDYSKNLLKSIEAGAGLYFSFIKEETVELQETKFRQFYANEYDKWVGDANTLYQQFTRDFANIYGQQIVNHRILQKGITETEYANGIVVIVNLNENKYEVNRTSGTQRGR